MTTQMHLAAQYLAAAGVSFVAKKEDDSHTNLGFSQTEGSMYSRPLNNDGVLLSLDYTLFSLVWKNTNETHFKLDGKTHAEILHWINERALESKMGAYTYDLHYELPYAISDTFTFQLTDANRLKELLQIRTLAQNVLSSFLDKEQFQSEIRIWPHHFDTGAFFALGGDANISIGLGLSIPDTVADDYYYYISGYHGHDGIATDDFEPLTQGSWSKSGFKGAILRATGVEEAVVLNFFTEAMEAFKN